uniref:Uncharacterized protein n=1 Tax=Pyxicephalus adspersus TaxID=30357 RepID=A0AAV2ZM99_PYXAD|nr:TPA: hypothetical protein GDO54_002904 [Pyxicephalus adspersus]
MGMKCLMFLLHSKLLISQFQYLIHRGKRRIRFMGRTKIVPSTYKLNSMSSSYLRVRNIVLWRTKKKFLLLQTNFSFHLLPCNKRLKL